MYAHKNRTNAKLRLYVFTSEAGEPKPGPESVLYDVEEKIRI